MFDAILSEYLPVLIFFLIAFAISAMVVVASWLVAPQRPDSEKLSPYECGFEPFDDSRGRFDVRFYLVALLFIIFDLEVAFFFPGALALREIGSFGLWSLVPFLFILTVGLDYEWE